MANWSEEDLLRLRGLYAGGAAVSTMVTEMECERRELFPAIARAIVADAPSRMEMLRLCAIYNLGPEEITVLTNIYEKPDVSHLVEAVLMLDYRGILAGAWPMQRFAHELREHSPTASQLAEVWRTLATYELTGHLATSDMFDLVSHRWRLGETDRAIVACRLSM